MRTRTEARRGVHHLAASLVLLSHRAGGPASAGPVTAQTAVTQPPPQAPASAAELREELQRLRQEFESIRDAYGARLAALESRLAQQAGAAATPPAVAGQAPAALPAPVPPLPAEPTPVAARRSRRRRRSPEVAVPAGAAGAGGPAGALPVYGNANAMSKIFNPDIAVIGNFVGAAGRNDDRSRCRRCSSSEAELSLQAVVDPYARADFFLAASPEGLEIEEGFITFPTLPGGLLVKVGKLKAQFGKANTLHSHVMPWVDQPLVDAEPARRRRGPERLRHLGLEADSQPGAVPRGDRRDLPGAERSLHEPQPQRSRLRGRGCAATATSPRRTNLDLGTSFAYGHNDAGDDTTTRVVGIDATVRYRPLRRAIYRRFIGRTELLWSRRGETTGDVGSFGMYGSARLPVRAALVRRRAATTGPSAPTTRRSSTRGRRCC